MYLRYDSPPCVFGSWVYHNIICCWHYALYRRCLFSMCIFAVCVCVLLTVTLSLFWAHFYAWPPDYALCFTLCSSQTSVTVHRTAMCMFFYVARVCLCFVVVLYVALALCATNLANRLLPTIVTIAHNCALPISKNPQTQTSTRSEFVIRDTTKKRNYITWQYLFCNVRRRDRYTNYAFTSSSSLADSPKTTDCCYASLDQRSPQRWDIADFEWADSFEWERRRDVTIEIQYETNTVKPRKLTKVCTV